MALITLAGSDCEMLHLGWLGQPANSVSSLAYVVAGVYVLRAAGPKAPALALAAVGVGSVLYHGSTVPAAEVTHNGSLAVLAIVFLVTLTQGSLRRPPLPALVVLATAIVLNGLTRTGASLCAPDSILQGHAAWHVLTAVSASMWLSTKTSDSPTQSAHGTTAAGDAIPSHGQ